MKKLFTLFFTLAFSLYSFAEADYVYHEASTSTIGTGTLRFRDVLIPDRTQPVKIGFKIEFQFYWNQARIYYTTDGSNPSGAFGVGTGTTQVLTATFDHNFGSPIVDAVTATIPAQPAGTVVKYIVSAWSSGGGDEIFGNGCGNAPRTFCSTDNKLASNATIFSYTVLSYARKTFRANLPTPVSLNNANGSCAIPGAGAPSVFSVPVSGVGNLGPANQLLLASIALSNCGSGTVNLNEVQIRIISPSGTCLGVYSGGLSTIATGVHYVNLVTSTTCLNNPNTTNDLTSGGPLLSSGNNGYFNAQFNGVASNYTAFNGATGDGTWRVVFSETTTTPPCVERIALTFGDPNVINQGTTGNTCPNPIVWDGKSPICATTSGMNGSVQMPGSLSGPNTNGFGTIGGATCQWNGANNNDVWIKYTAIDNWTCLTVSGISGTNVTLQSVVVTDANVDNDNNPCTGPTPTNGNDSRWSLASCPRNAIYGTTAGTQLNQQHCFTSEIGKTYYLVVDGDGGAASKFWVWGNSYNSQLPLEETKYVVFNRPKTNLDVRMTFNGYIITQLPNNESYEQRIEMFDASGRLLYANRSRVNNYNSTNVDQFSSIGVNLIRVTLTDRNGLVDVYSFKHVKTK